MKTFIIALFSLLLLITIKGEPLQDFVSGNKLFTTAAYKEIIKTQKGNVLVSPLSIEILLAAIQSGAKGETGQEIRTHLHLPNIKEDTEAAIKAILPQLKGDGKYSLHTANKMYIKKGFSVKDQFKAVITETYQSDVEDIDFIQKEQAANTMNKWVEDHTNNKIHDLIKSDDLEEKTAAILINALYFKGNWALPFSDSSTLKEKFYITSKDTIEVDMMHLHKKFFKYYEDKELDARFLELPFESRNVSMVFILPNQKEGISALENKIDKVFAEYPLESRVLDIGIPKFKIESQIDFKEVLYNLGVRKAFDKGQADFSEIVGEKGFLWIDKIRQKTFIDVNEVGVEAAAASFGEWFYTAAWGSPPKFIADHPFIFYIKCGNMILFAGKVTTPVE